MPNKRHRPKTHRDVKPAKPAPRIAAPVRREVASAADFLDERDVRALLETESPATEFCQR